jgi:hypothetical protein
VPTTTAAGLCQVAPAGVQPRRVTLQFLHRGPGRSRRALALAADAAYLAGAFLLLWSASIHFHLWGETDGYRSVPTIGWLFLLQSIAGLVLGIGVVVIRRVWAALLGAGLALATIAGFLISVVHGLFGFQDSWLAPFATQAFAIEVAAAAVLGVAAVLSLVGSVPGVRTGSSPAGSGT